MKAVNEKLAHLDPAHRTALTVCALLNLAMLFLEGGVGCWIGSAALLADAVDFLEDAAILGLALVAIRWSPRARATAGLIQGIAMAGVEIAAVAQVVRTIWLSTRNDAFLNVLTIAAAGAIAATGSGWPDIVAGAIIASINLWAAAGVTNSVGETFDKSVIVGGWSGNREAAVCDILYRSSVFPQRKTIPGQSTVLKIVKEAWKWQW